VTLTPAYGRDYTSLAKAKADWEAGKDFIIADISNRWDGKPCSKRDCKGQEIMIRYNKLRKIGRVQ